MAYTHAIDLALKSALDEQINVTIEGQSYPVQCYVQAPEEQFAKAQYPVPSMGVYLFDISHDPVREYEKIYQYSDITGTTIRRRPAPVKFDFRYQVTTSAYYTQHDRQLIKLIQQRLPVRGTLPVVEEGVTSPKRYDLYIFMEGFQSLDAMGEYRLFRKSLTYRIQGWLDEQSLTTQKLAYAGAVLGTDGIDVGVSNATLDDIAAR